MQCAKCKRWTIDPQCSYYTADTQWGNCDREGPGEVTIKGDAVVDEYTTNGLSFCSEFSERTAEDSGGKSSIAQHAPVQNDCSPGGSGS